MGTNIDAALALSLSYSLGAKGQVIAVAVSNSSLEAAAFCDAVSRLYVGDRSPLNFGASGLPVGLAENGPKLGATPMLSGPLAMKKPAESSDATAPSSPITTDAATKLAAGKRAQEPAAKPAEKPQ
jgi:hypothetical protein